MQARFTLAVLSLVLLSATAEGQAAQQAAAGVSFFSRQTTVTQSPALSALASGILPGAGQAMMRQKRSVIYLALEAAGVGYYLSQHREGERDRDRYRSLSRNVARAGLSSTGPAGNWDYYERMEKYIASGEYDIIAGGSVDPEPDEQTFNGAMWLLARQTFWRDAGIPPPLESAEYRAALEFYMSRAVKPEFRWSWTADPEAFQQYRSAISSSNAAFRHAEQIVSLVLANHFLSAVDAYAAVKLRMRRAGDGATALVASLPF